MKLYSNLKKYIKLYLLTILVSIAFSCTDDLEIGVNGEPELKNFYKTPEEAELGLNSAYFPLREMFGRENFGGSNSNDFVFGDIGTDDIFKGGARVNDGPHLFEKETYGLTTSNLAVSIIWKVNYKGVFYSNLILNKVDDIDFKEGEDKEEDKEAAVKRQSEILSEAHFLRAYYYFNLVKSFGGIPLIENVLDINTVSDINGYNVARSSKEESYTFIENDLKKAIEGLPSRFDKGPAFLGRADKGAALGLMMRVSLYQNKMDQVKTYGEQLFALGYELQDFSIVFEPEGEWNKGSVFEINYVSNSDNLGSRLAHMIGPRSKPQRGIGFAQIKEDLRNEFEVNDPRFTASFYEKKGGYGTGWYNKKYSIAPNSKYKAPKQGGRGNNANNIRLIRLSDVYLMYAEAIYNIDAPKSVEYVNKVRTRARGVEDVTVVPDLDAALSGQPLLDAIYHERRVEFAGEGLRYHDLVRTGRAGAILGPLGFKVGTHEVMPIPLDQVTQSQGVLTQNNY